MTAQLNYLVAQERLADLARSAERQRLAQRARPIGSRRSRRAWSPRLLVGLGVVANAVARRAGTVRSLAQ
jgi:hypothetical protein